MDNLEQEVREYVANFVTEGFSTGAEIIESAVEVFADTYDASMVLNYARRVTRILLEEHYTWQEHWLEMTDCDRLDQAFDELNRRGIVARQHFTCCTNCGRAEIEDEIAQLSEVQEVKGFVFYHWQDTEGVMLNGTLYLAYGAVGRWKHHRISVGREIVAVMCEYSLNVEWDGNVNRRIRLTSFDWKRRRVEESLDEL